MWSPGAGVVSGALVMLLTLGACTDPRGGSTDATTAPPSPTSSPVEDTGPPGPSGTPEHTPSVSPEAPPSLDPPEHLLGQDWERLPTSDPVVALTFDGGASDAAVGAILGTLDAEDVRATFFLTGDFARRYPTSVAAIAAGGHRLGNHSDTHASYPRLRDVEIEADLARAEAAISDAAGGAAVRPLFRFPYGDRTAADVRAVNRVGYVPVRWTVDTLGWRGTSGGMSADGVVSRVLDTAVPGQIVLLHVGAHPTDGSTLDADALPKIIRGLRERGYSFVTLDALVR